MACTFVHALGLVMAAVLPCAPLSTSIPPSPATHTKGRLAQLGSVVQCIWCPIFIHQQCTGQAQHWPKDNHGGEESSDEDARRLGQGWCWCGVLEPAFGMICSNSTDTQRHTLS